MWFKMIIVVMRWLLLQIETLKNIRMHKIYLIIIIVCSLLMICSPKYTHSSSVCFLLVVHNDKEWKGLHVKLWIFLDMVLFSLWRKTKVSQTRIIKILTIKFQLCGLVFWVGLYREVLLRVCLGCLRWRGNCPSYDGPDSASYRQGTVFPRD